MKYTSFFWIACIGFSLLSTPALAGPTAANEGIIKKATQACEKEVPAHCVKVSCPAFCKTQGKEAAECKKNCTSSAHCKLKPLSKDKKGFSKLDAQNNDQLMACIAEKRDPKAEKSGRREEKWQTLGTFK